MKVWVAPYGEAYTVRFSQGNQGFRLDYNATKTECMWMARMLRKAIRFHDKEVIKKLRKK